MKKLLLTITFIFLFALSAFGQCSDIEDCNKKLSDASQMVEKLLTIQERDEKAINDKQATIDSLKTVIAELERARATPCTLAQEKVKQDLTYWLNQKGDERELRKILKFTRKNGQRLLQAQCGYSEKSALAKVWEIGKVLIPVGAILVTRWYGNNFNITFHSSPSSSSGVSGLEGERVVR